MFFGSFCSGFRHNLNANLCSKWTNVVLPCEVYNAKGSKEWELAKIEPGGIMFLNLAMGCTKQFD